MRALEKARRAKVRGLRLTVAAVAAGLAGTAARADVPPPPPTQDFVQAAAQTDEFEITEAQLALVEGRDPRVRAFAQRMIQDHMATSQALRQAAAAAGLAPPPIAMSGDQAMLLSGLQGQRGPDFDRAYVRHQVLGHQQALVVEQGYADRGTDAAVRQAARSAVPVIAHHLDDALRLCVALACGG